MSKEHPKYMVIYSNECTSESVWDGEEATDEELAAIICDTLVEDQCFYMLDNFPSIPSNPHEWTEGMKEKWDEWYYNTECYAIIYDPSVPETSKYSCGDGYVDYDVLSYEDEWERGILDYEDLCKKYDKEMAK